MLARRDLIRTVLIQGLGAVANVAITTVIASRFGPSGQGFWASFKSLLDVVSVAAAYGFPAGFPFLINVRGVSDVSLLRFSLAYGLFLIPCTAVVVIAAWTAGIVHLASLTPHLEISLITVASAEPAGQAMVRWL